MRPQHITAENSGGSRASSARSGASMRPQHITAENASVSMALGGISRSFNEAAAYHCGKRAGSRR